uniref:Phosphatase tensin-type domain-containing protein n=1 Tax=Periophthalmus magnuspinnatus TaxID=409849 RepID=A0A3B3ZPM8_9GOBI
QNKKHIKSTEKKQRKKGRKLHIWQKIALPIDLTYITERIITVVCPRECSDDSYLHNLSQITHMLHSKHGHNYMVRSTARLVKQLYNINQKIVVDTGWTDQLAPNLDQIINVCTAMENWLHRHHKHVLVLHCRVKTYIQNHLLQLRLSFPSKFISIAHLRKSSTSKSASHKNLQKHIHR